MKKSLVLIGLAIVFAMIAFLFWYNEFVYSLPTPIPKNYQAVNLGNKVDITESLHAETSKPVFLHFFNPDCPCSKFNISLFKTLVKQYSNEATFAIVVMSSKNYSARQIQDRFKLNLPVLFDTSLAKSCGVYSTPQAVIINTYQRLYYRGNYNRSRYCTDKSSNYAQQALDNLIHNNYAATFNQYALKAYGCQLPMYAKISSQQ